MNQSKQKGYLLLLWGLASGLVALYVLISCLPVVSHYWTVRGIVSDARDEADKPGTTRYDLQRVIVRGVKESELDIDPLKSIKVIYDSTNDDVIFNVQYTDKVRILPGVEITFLFDKEL